MGCLGQQSSAAATTREKRGKVEFRTWLSPADSLFENELKRQQFNGHSVKSYQVSRMWNYTIRSIEAFEVVELVKPVRASCAYNHRLTFCLRTFVWVLGGHRQWRVG